MVQKLQRIMIFTRKELVLFRCRLLRATNATWETRNRLPGRSRVRKKQSASFPRTTLFRFA